MKVIQFYPELLSLYADRGNLMVLQKRAERQGFQVQVQRLNLGDSFDSDKADIVLMGGGQDRDQQLVAHHLRRQLSPLRDFIERGAPVLAVCGSYQLLGNEYRFDVNGTCQVIEGIGLLDMVTVAKSPRLIGNVRVRVDVDEVRGPDSSPAMYELVGFENHAGRTKLGSHVQPLGKVIIGHGNDGESGFEGARYRNLFGTYVHGPLLPRNPWLADFLIRLALGQS